MIRSSYIQSGELVIISRLKSIFKIKFFRSIRFRIMMLLFFIGIVPTILIETVLLHSQFKRSLEQRIAVVQNQCDIICDQLDQEGYLDDPDNEVVNGELGILTNIYGGRALVINSDYEIVHDTFHQDTGKYMVSDMVIKCFEGEESHNYDAENSYIELAVGISDPSDKDAEVTGVLLISVSTTEIDLMQGYLQRRGIILLFIMIALILLIGYIMSGVLVKPLQKITDSIDEITEGYLEEDISVPDYLETELITDAFNRMMKRIRTLDESREEFVSNVSHELKTPLASMKVLADALNSMPDLPVEQYQEFMQDISQEIDRENSIITDLLSLVKLDRKAENLNIETVNINDLLEMLIKRLKPIADLKNVHLILDSFRPVNAEIDQTKIALALSNIIENAIKYNNPEGGWVRISLNADQKYFYVTIADSGIGIPEEAQDHIFERFYRVDKSHSREIGGTGLGLAITRNAIVMHRGAIRVYSKPNEGTTFSIRLPLVYIS